MSEHEVGSCDPECPLCGIDQEIEEHLASCRTCNESDTVCDTLEGLFQAQDEVCRVWFTDQDPGDEDVRPAS